MAIKIPASKIYSTEFNNSTKNRINASSSVYKRAKVLKNVAVSNKAILNLWSLSIDNSLGNFVGTIEGTNTTVEQNGSFDYNFTLKDTVVIVAPPTSNASHHLGHSNKIRYKATWLRFPKDENGKTQITEFIDRYIDSSFLASRPKYDDYIDYSEIAYYTLPDDAPQYYYSGDTIPVNIELINLIKETSNYAFFLETLEIYVGGGGEAIFEDITETSMPADEYSPIGQSFRESENSFRQEETTLEGSEFKLSNYVMSAYQHGRQTAVIEVASSDYYDEGKNQIIGTDDRPVFENGDIVIPYRIVAQKDNYGVVTYKEIPLSTYGSLPMRFVVINNHIYYRGILKQKLELIEANHSTSTFELRNPDAPTPNSIRTDIPKEQ